MADPLQRPNHSRAFLARRTRNWLTLGLTYAAMYMARYNFPFANKALSDEYDRRFALKRGGTGVTKNELLVTFKGTDYSALMAEVQALERLGYVVQEEIGPANFRVLLTPKGEATLARAGREEFVVEEPT